MYGKCLYCNEPYTGRQWCNKCDPDFLARNWNIENESIRELILNNVRQADHYDDPFLEYIPYENLEIIKRIGEGGYGVVYHAKWKNGLRYCEGNEGNVRSRRGSVDVAMKELKDGFDISKNFLSKIEAHFQCYYEDQRSLTQKLLRLYGIAQNPETKNYVIVMDYKEANLRNFLDNKIYESLESLQSHWTSRIEILFNISTGMKRVHRTGCIHRNLHCGNILVKIKANRIHTYVAGFGFSSDIETNSNRNVVSGVLPYIAPEVLYGQPQTEESDVYSFGVIMTEMTTGIPPFHDRPHDESLAREICEEGLRPDMNISITPPNYFRLAKKCLDADSAKRPSFDELDETLGFWYDTLFGHGLYANRKEDIAAFRMAFVPSDDVEVESDYTLHEGACYTRRTFEFSQFSEPKNHDDHYSYIPLQS